MADPNVLKKQQDMDEASRKMHEYLEKKQRRQEEYWLRKYGKVLYPALPKAENKPMDGHKPGGFLPPIRGGGEPGGQAPLFQAAGPIKTFPMSGAPLNGDRRHHAHPLPQGNILPPISQGAYSPKAEASEQTLTTTMLELDDNPYGSQSPSPKSRLLPGGGLAQPHNGPIHLAPLDQIPAVENSSPKGAHVSPKHEFSHKQAVRDLQMELAVLKTIKGREDVLDRLRTAGNKFIDDYTFLKGRMLNLRPVDDPFLVELTPDGVAIEEATTMDLRRGRQRFSSDALRIRMARKALASYHKTMPPKRPALLLRCPSHLNGSQGPGVLLQDHAPQVTHPHPNPHPCLPPRTHTPSPSRLPHTGGQRFSSDALRIRMARKALASYHKTMAPKLHDAASSTYRPFSASSFGSMAEEGYQNMLEERRAAAESDITSYLGPVKQYASARGAGEHHMEEHMGQQGTRRPNVELDHLAKGGDGTAGWRTWKQAGAPGSLIHLSRLAHLEAGWRTWKPNPPKQAGTPGSRLAHLEA
eukprot:gene7789-979_t